MIVYKNRRGGPWGPPPTNYKRVAPQKRGGGSQRAIYRQGLSMGVDEEEAHRGWKRRSDTVQDLSSWFCQLSTQERLQVSAHWLRCKTAGVVPGSVLGFCC